MRRRLLESLDENIEWERRRKWESMEGVQRQAGSSIKKDDDASMWKVFGRTCVCACRHSGLRVVQHFENHFFKSYGQISWRDRSLLLLIPRSKVIQLAGTLSGGEPTDSLSLSHTHWKIHTKSKKRPCSRTASQAGLAQHKSHKLYRDVVSSAFLSFWCAYKHITFLRRFPFNFIQLHFLSTEATY